MPRREHPDPFALRVGLRIRQLREERGLTIEALAFESERGSKGHLSSLERGFVRPTIQTLYAIAERLGVLPLDLLTFPDDDERQQLVDRTRRMTRTAVRRLLLQAVEGYPPVRPRGVKAAEFPPTPIVKAPPARPRRK